jgi:hypothetical protein
MKDVYEAGMILVTFAFGAIVGALFWYLQDKRIVLGKYRRGLRTSVTVVLESFFTDLRRSPLLKIDNKYYGSLENTIDDIIDLCRNDNLSLLTIFNKVNNFNNGICSENSKEVLSKDISIKEYDKLKLAITRLKTCFSYYKNYENLPDLNRYPCIQDYILKQVEIEKYLKEILDLFKVEEKKYYIRGII